MFYTTAWKNSKSPGCSTPQRGKIQKVPDVPQRGKIQKVPDAPQRKECVSYTRLRIGVVSQPFCVDQLNPAGFNVFNVPYKENSRFFPSRETGNLKINMAEADLSPTAFTSSSANDSD